MNRKELALETIRCRNHQKILTEIPTYTLSYLGADHDGYEGHVDELHRPVGSRWTDIWGTEWHKEYPDLMGLPSYCPISEPEKLAEYHWPDPDDERIIGAIYRGKEEFDRLEDRENYILCGSHRDTLWEKSYMLVGMEAMMEYFYTEPEFAEEILDRIMEFQLGIARHYLAVGVEMVDMSDDLGSQTSLLMSPAMIQEFLVPRYRKLFEVYKKAGVLVHFHSCGHVLPLFDTFVDLGVDVLNPIQVSANNREEVAASAKGRLSLHGGVSSSVLMTGTPEEIDAEVREAIRVFGKDGGYFCSPDQYMPYPPENLEIMRASIERWGNLS